MTGLKWLGRHGLPVLRAGVDGKYRNVPGFLGPLASTAGKYRNAAG